MSSIFVSVLSFFFNCRAASTRLVTGMWWFFALMMLNSYTANLAAFLTNSRQASSINNAEDLAAQNKIKYGALLGGSTMGFFRDSNFSTYQKMWTAMDSARPSVFTKTNDEGVERVQVCLPLLSKSCVCMSV